MIDRRRGFSIQTKLLLLLAVLLLIPWLGYTYVREMQSFLLQGQSEALQLSSRAIATVLHDRVELFDPDTGVPDIIGGPYDLFAYQLQSYPELDGQPNDWRQTLDFETIYFDHRGNECTKDYVSSGFSFAHLLGYRGRYLYALFRVADDDVLLRNKDSRNLDNADHLRLTIEDPLGILRRYLMTTNSAGNMAVYQMDENWRFPISTEPVTEIRAVLGMSDDGYNIEVRIPRYVMAPNSGVGFSVVDVDDRNSRVIRERISTASGLEDETLGRIRISSPELRRILRGIDRPQARVWILDSEQRVRAVVGRLAGDRNQVEETRDDSMSIAQRFRSLADRFGAFLLEPPPPVIEDHPTDLKQRPEEIFRRVLDGETAMERRPSLDGRAEILMAAEPIWHADAVLGAVVVEQSSGKVLAAQYRTIRRLTLVSLVVFGFVTVALLLFTSRLALRIRKLRDEAERAISPEGRVLAENLDVDTQAGDEVGDLSRSLTGMLGRLTQYMRYLEAMPDTLAHEMNNPLNVVGSSLENLERETDPVRRKEYMQRARNGIQRLGTIMRSLTEAANFEDAIASEEQEHFDLTELITSYVDGYRLSQPQRKFDLDVPEHSVVINGVPDHIAQMLDKLADNAIEFGDPDKPIVFQLRVQAGTAMLSVINDGPALPEHLGERLFDPMVSVAQTNASHTHLGLGLYIVRLIVDFHQGRVQATSRNQDNGAKVTVSLPLAA